MRANLNPGNKTPILTDHNTYPPLQTDPQQPPSGSSKVNLHSSNLATPTTNSPSCTCLPRLLLSSLPVDLGPFRHASQSPRKDLPNTQRDSALLVQPTKTQSPLQITKEKSPRENLPSIKRDLQKKPPRNPENTRQALSPHHQVWNQNPLPNRWEPYILPFFFTSYSNHTYLLLSPWW